MGDQKPPNGGDLIKFDKKRKVSKQKIKITDPSTTPAVPSGKTPREAGIERFRENYFNPERIGGELPKYHQDNISRAQVLNSLDSVKDFIASGGSLEDGVREKINEILDDHSNRLKMFLIGVSHVRVNNLTTLMRDIDSIEKELSCRNLENLPTETLLSYYNSLSNREQAMLKYLKELPDMGLPGRIESKDDQENASRVLEATGINSPNVATRRNVRDLLDKIARELVRKEKKVPNRKLLVSGDEKTTK